MLKQILSVLAVTSLLTPLTGCPETPANPEPTAEATEAPTEEPSEEPAEAPAEEPSEEPAEPPAEEPSEEPAEPPTEEPAEITQPENALETPDEQNAAFNISGASAVEIDGFRYQFTIVGTGLGSTADYEFLQVKASAFTAPLIDSGEVKSIGDASDISVSPTEIKFIWRSDAPTNNDLIQITGQRTGEAQVSTSVRLSVTKK